VKLSIGNDTLEVYVSQDPVTLRWEWRGYAGGERKRGLADTETLTAEGAQQWALQVARQRVREWTVVVARLEAP